MDYFDPRTSVTLRFIWIGLTTWVEETRTKTTPFAAVSIRYKHPSRRLKLEQYDKDLLWSSLVLSNSPGGSPPPPRTGMDAPAATDGSWSFVVPRRSILLVPQAGTRVRVRRCPDHHVDHPSYP